LLVGVDGIGGKGSNPRWSSALTVVRK
jgi:hypothetical protein